MKKILFIWCFFLLQLTYAGVSEREEDICNLYLDKLDYEDAIRCFQKLLPLNKKGVRKDIGYAYLQLGKYGEAEKFFKEELVLNSQDSETVLLLGCTYFRWGKMEKAFDIFMNYLTWDKTIARSRVSNKMLPNIGLAEYVLGLYFKNKGDLYRALKHFSESIIRGYDLTKNIIQISDIYTKMGDLSSALKQLELEGETYRISYPYIRGYKESSTFTAQLDCPEVYFLKGYILYEMGKIEESLENFNKATRLEPAFKEARKNIASIYYNKGDYDTAWKKFQSLKMRFPEDSLIEECYIYTYLRMNKSEGPDKFPITKKCVDEEVPEFKYKLRNDKKYILKSLNSEGLALLKNGFIKEGLSKFITALKIDSKSPEINYNVGLIFANLENYEDAYLYARRAVDNKNDFLEAWDLMGKAHFHMKEFDKSISAYKKAVELNPKDAQSYYNLGCAYHAAKSYHEAENAWFKAIKLDRRGKEKGEDIADKTSIDKSEAHVKVLKRTISFHSYKSLGSLYQEKGEIKKAIESYQKAIEIFPTDADCYYELGKLYIQTGEKENAVKNLQKYLEYGTEKEKEVRELLKELKEK